MNKAEKHQFKIAIDEFDFESKSELQIAGNIYLAKVTRVEPSLQAAFIEYGGNRHGFLAYSEIHPDYYQIPIADREALIAEELAYSKKAEEQAEVLDDVKSDDALKVAPAVKPVKSLSQKDKSEPIDILSEDEKISETDEIEMSVMPLEERSLKLNLLVIEMTCLI